MMDDKFKAVIGDLVFQNILLNHKIEELQKQLEEQSQQKQESDEK